MVRIHGEEGGFWCDAALVVMTVATLAVFGIEVVFYHKGATKHHYFVKPPLHGTLYPIWILILGLTVVLEGWALPDSLGCSSPAAYGPTISRISASILSQGYTYMLVIFVRQSEPSLRCYADRFCSVSCACVRQCVFTCVESRSAGLVHHQHDAGLFPAQKFDGTLSP